MHRGYTFRRVPFSTNPAGGVAGPTASRLGEFL